MEEDLEHLLWSREVSQKDIMHMQQDKVTEPHKGHCRKKNVDELLRDLAKPVF